MENIDQARFAAHYELSVGEPVASAMDPIERILVNQKLAADVDGGLLPTNLGVLLFSARPATWLNGAYVDIAVYDHEIADGNTRDTQRVDGTIPEQIEQVLRYLQASPMLATRST